MNGDAVAHQNLIQKQQVPRSSLYVVMWESTARFRSLLC